MRERERLQVTGIFPVAPDYRAAESPKMGTGDQGGVSGCRMTRLEAGRGARIEASTQYVVVSRVGDAQAGVRRTP